MFVNDQHRLPVGEGVCFGVVGRKGSTDQTIK